MDCFVRCGGWSRSVLRSSIQFCGKRIRTLKVTETKHCQLHLNITLQEIDCKKTVIYASTIHLYDKIFRDLTIP